jgi:hypothetical protein
MESGGEVRDILTDNLSPEFQARLLVEGFANVPCQMAHDTWHHTIGMSTLTVTGYTRSQGWAALKCTILS